VERNHTAAFSTLRKQNVDKALLEVSRLEKRLSRLTQLLASLPVDQIQSGASKRWSISWQNDQRKTLEQSVVSWQDDAGVSRCPFCQRDFSTYIFRRHHCRTCGRVVCGDLETACSSEIGLNIAASMSHRVCLTSCMLRLFRRQSCV
jgi:rabenosyn-5